MTFITILTNWKKTTMKNYSEMTAMISKKNESHPSFGQTQHAITVLVMEPSQMKSARITLHSLSGWNFNWAYLSTEQYLILQ